MYIYQNIDGTGLTKAGWEKESAGKNFILKEYRNGKIWVQLRWIGRYRKDLPAEYRHSHEIQVLNRLIERKSEWDEEETIDKGWQVDPSASQSFRTRSAAESAFEDMLLTYTESYIDMDEETGETTLVQEGNELGPKTGPLKLEVNEEVEKAAASKGISLGGWS